MAQKLFEDKIGTLSHSGGTITMTASSSSPAYLSIGGQQYKITSDLTLAVGTATANTLYMIYAILNAGVVELVKSTNVNSTGPAGENSWKLVGAFYTGVTDTFGGFVNIEGSPISERINYETNFQATTIDPTIVNGDLRSSWSRKGDELHVTVGIRWGGSDSIGSGNYFFSIPAGLTPDVLRMAWFSGGLGLYSGEGSGFIRDGSAGQTDSTRRTAVSTWSPSNEGIQVAVDAEQQLNSSTFPWTSNDEIVVSFKCPIEEWSNTPLKGL